MTERACPGKLMLFDLEGDIGETSDVAADHPETVQRLQQLADRI